MEMSSQGHSLVALCALNRRQDGPQEASVLFVQERALLLFPGFELRTFLIYVAEKRVLRFSQGCNCVPPCWDLTLRRPTSRSITLPSS